MSTRRIFIPFKKRIILAVISKLLFAVLAGFLSPGIALAIIKLIEMIATGSLSF